ncbi:MAG: NADH:ubiquinone reductase (Na(+)-transporting) subunit F, partial [Muribaculaceae bacterium]|nr:NADH:ubiquinone reductase (Na(+)-transporting) subunit F [Muribaculaceae bacterium]
MTEATVVLDVLSLTVWTAVGVFLAVTIALVLILLVAKRYLVSSGKVKITVNSDAVVEVESGGSLLSS